MATCGDRHDPGRKTGAGTGDAATLGLATHTGRPHKTHGPGVPAGGNRGPADDHQPDRAAPPPLTEPGYTPPSFYAPPDDAGDTDPH